MSSVTRLTLTDDVAALVAEAEPSSAYAVLMQAAEQQDDGREITLAEALTVIFEVAAYVEAIR